MNYNTIELVRSAIAYAREHPKTFQNTTVAEDAEIESTLMLAFIAGAEYAKDYSESST